MSVAGMKFNVLAQIMVDHNAMNFPKAINFGLCLLTLWSLQKVCYNF